MDSVYWNALRQHDEVFVHDDANRLAALERGTVMLVDTTPRSVGILVQSGPLTGQIMRPARLAVHLDRGECRGCWRCQLSATRAG